MSQKKLSLILLLLTVVILVGSITTSIIMDKKQEEKDAETMPTLIGTIEEEYMEEDIALTDAQTSAKEDNNLQDYPYRVCILNLNLLADTALPPYGVESLEPYLTNYIDYYMQTGMVYEGCIVEGSYVDNYNLPYFTVRIDDLDLEIQCTYYVSRQTYLFNSRLNPDE